MSGPTEGKKLPFYLFYPIIFNMGVNAGYTVFIEFHGFYLASSEHYKFGNC